MARGFLGAGKCQKGQVMATVPSAQKAERLQAELGIRVTTDNREATSWARVIIFCVKPQVLPKVLKEVAEVVEVDKLVVSVAAGMNTRFIEDVLGKDAPVIRLMPNVAVLSREGATALCWGRFARPEEIAYVRDLFSSVGMVMEVEEGLMDAVTGLSGTGPMYVFQMIEGLSDAGVKVGLSREKAHLLAIQTVVGAGLMARDLGEHPAHLKDLVTSPAGTAISALHLMERSGFRAILMDAVEEATRRSAELGRVHMGEAREG